MAYADPERRREFNRQRSRRRTAERVARGMCPRCGRQSPAPGGAVCDPCAEKRRIADRIRDAKRRAAGIKRVRDPKARQTEYQRAKAKAAKRLAQGLCSKCGRHPYEPERKLCAGCSERRRRRDRERYAKARDAGELYGGKPVASKRRHARRRTRQRQRARRVAGLCIRCGRSRPVDGASSCGTCLQARRTADRLTYAARRAAGLCTRCATPAFDGALLCGPCSVVEASYQPKKSEASRARYAERRARWVCTHCGRNPTFGASRCEDCASREYERAGHACGMPNWDPGCTVVDRASGDDLGTWDRWEDAILSLSFAGLSLDDVELLVESSPMHSIAGWN